MLSETLPQRIRAGLSHRALRSEGFGSTAPSEIKFGREVLPGTLTAWTQCISGKWTEARDKGGVPDGQWIRAEF